MGLEISQVDYSAGDADLGDFPHYMLKEIFEQTLSVQNTVRGRLNLEESTAQLGGLNLNPQELREVERILITGCGTAMHSGIVGEYIIESLAHLPVEIDYASEFRLRNSPLDRRTPGHRGSARAVRRRTRWARCARRGARATACSASATTSPAPSRARPTAASTCTPGRR